MPAKEIKELRQAGKLDEAMQMAKSEYEASLENVWTKRNLSWVIYEYLKANAYPEYFDLFLQYLKDLRDLGLPEDDKMIFDSLSFQLGKLIFGITKSLPIDSRKVYQLFEVIKLFPFTRPSEGYNFIFKAFHKGLKGSAYYIEFVDWWGLENLSPEDFQKEKLPNGKEVMAVAEQAYIAYAKQLLPIKNPYGELIFDRSKAEAFLPILSEIVDKYPQFQYPGYFQAKLLLALGNRDNMLSALLPFARKKQNDFWVWEILAEAFPNEADKIFACYCKALSCKSPEEMLVSLRQKMAGLLIDRKLFTEAKTEIEKLVKSKTAQDFKIPQQVVNWQGQEWYANATSQKSNMEFYKKHSTEAEALLFSDTPEELLIVEFVNEEKKFLNFIASEDKYGFFKYDRFFNTVEVGQILSARFQEGSKGGMFKLYTLEKTNNDDFRSQFLKELDGQLRVPDGKSFGFVDNVFVPPNLISQGDLKNGDQVSCSAIRSYDKEKSKWGWKMIRIKTKMAFKI